LQLIKALSFRQFTLIWSGQTISRLGDNLYRIALSWWVLEKTGSAAVMGTVLIFSMTPMLIFSLFGGVAVDRFSRVKVMLVSDLVRGLVVATVAGLSFSGRLEIWHIYGASIFFGLVSAFFQPAYTAVLPEILPAEALPNANSLTSLSTQIANIAGPALGAVLVGLGGTSLGFALDAVSFIASAVCIFPLLSLPQSGKAGWKGLHLTRELLTGIRAVTGSAWLWITIAIAALINVTVSGPISVALPFLVSDHLGRDVGSLGLIYSFMSAGSVLGALWLGRYARLRKRGLIAYGAWIVTGLAILAFGLPIPFEGVLAAALVNGFCLSLFGLVWTNTLQEMVPGHLLGRVASIDNIGSFVLLPVGFGLSGLLTDQFGAAWVFIGGGVITAVLTAVGLLHPAIRNLD